MTKKIDIKKVILAGLFCAIAYILTFVFRFHVAFLTFDFKDTIIAIASLILGPIYGVAISLVVAFIEMITVSGTGFYGFIMNFAASAVFSLVIGLIYKYKRTFFGALAAVATAFFAVVCCMILLNLFVTPYYMGTNIKEVIAIIPTLLLPFNICKYVINGCAILILYKPFTKLLKKAKLMVPSGETKMVSAKSTITFIVCIILIVLAVTYIMLQLNGAFEFFKG